MCDVHLLFVFFFFKQKTAYEMRISDWSSDVCSSDLGKDSLAATRIARALASSGIGVLRFDFAGLGGSEGCFSDTTFAADVADLIAAGHAMAAVDKTPGLLIGHSLGGAAALMAAREIPSIRADRRRTRLNSRHK